MAPGVGDPEGDGARYGDLSLWWDSIPAPSPRPALPGNLAVDVCIVGAGFTGLWTAHALSRADPSLRIAVVEREVAGYGASGRNGGWCSALFATSDAALARLYGMDAMRAMRRAMQATVDIVGATAHAEGIDCHFAKGGTVDAARTDVQRTRALDEIAEARSFGFGEDDLRWLERADAEAMVGMEGMLGATFTPHCAAIQPALLARGLADAVERRGVHVYEHTEVIDIVPGDSGRSPVVRTTAGAVHADIVVRALEAWTPTLPGTARTLVPVYSLMVATEPLGDEFWRAAGLGGRATFTDYRHMIIYGQRTADDRIAFGGRGAPYHFGSAVRPSFDGTPSVHRLLRQTLIELFPALRVGPLHPRLGRPPGHPPRLALLGRPRSPTGSRLGRGVCGRRRRHDQPGRSDAGRPDHGRGHRAHRPSLGESPLPRLGARAPALVGRQRGAPGHETGRPHRGAQGPAQPPGHADGTVAGAVSGADVGRAPICPFCGVTALPSESVSWADPEFVCENPDCEAFGEPIAS